MFIQLIRWLLVFSLLPFVTNCQNETNTVSKDTANAYLLAALVKSGELDTYKNSFIELQGYWQDGFYVSSKYTKSSDQLIVTTTSEGIGSWSGPSSFGNTIRRIIEIDNTKNIFNL